MKTAIVYYSKHHGNTKKLLDAIAQKHEVTLIDMTDNPVTYLSEYDRIGFASGIYYSKFQKALLKYAQEYMPDNKETFLSVLTVQKRRDTQTLSPKQSVHITQKFSEISDVSDLTHSDLLS